MGFKTQVDPELVIPDPTMTLAEGAIAPWNKRTFTWYAGLLNAVTQQFNIPQDVPFKDLSKEEQQLLLYGAGRQKIKVSYQNNSGQLRTFETYYEGVIPNLERRYRETQSEHAKSMLESYMSSVPCFRCHGTRLKEESLAVTVGGKNIWEVTCFSVGQALQFFNELQLTERETLIARQILKEIRSRLGFLVNVGLDYMTLNRAAGTLSGGEAQRIRLATQIGSSLVGVLYILDEPSIGLHQRDNQRLIETLKSLRDIGNTVIVVEHDEETMYAADQIIDIGPGAGVHGGEIVAQGTVEEIKQVKGSVTADYLSGRKHIPLPLIRRQPNGKWLVIEGAREHNLKILM